MENVYIANSQTYPVKRNIIYTLKIKSAVARRNYNNYVLKQYKINTKHSDGTSNVKYFLNN